MEEGAGGVIAIEIIGEQGIKVAPLVLALTTSSHRSSSTSSSDKNV